MAKRAASRPGKLGSNKTLRQSGSKSPTRKGKPGKRSSKKGRPTISEAGVYARPGQQNRLPSTRPSNDPVNKTRRRPVKGKTAVNLPPRQDGERLQKIMAAAGVASRRECEQFILEGRVQVDGAVITELGVRVDQFIQQIAVDGEVLTRARKVYYALNKPDGVVCTAHDPAGRPRVTDLLPPDVGRIFNVGRLDMASEGLILLTNDGELANQLTHPKHGVEKIYHVQVQGFPTSETLASLRRGVYLAEGKAHFVHAKMKTKRKSSTILEVVLDEGRNREIRRVLARVGHKVQRLTRIAVGPVRLGDMPSGAYRILTSEEVKSLRVAATTGGKKTREEKAAASRSERSPRSPVKTRPYVKGSSVEKPGPTGRRPAGKRPVGKIIAKKPAEGSSFDPTNSVDDDDVNEVEVTSSSSDRGPRVILGVEQPASRSRSQGRGRSQSRDAAKPRGARRSTGGGSGGGSGRSGSGGSGGRSGGGRGAEGRSSEGRSSGGRSGSGSSNSERSGGGRSGARSQGSKSQGGKPSKGKKAGGKPTGGYKKTTKKRGR